MSTLTSPRTRRRTNTKTTTTTTFTSKQQLLLQLVIVVLAVVLQEHSTDAQKNLLRRKRPSSTTTTKSTSTTTEKKEEDHAALPPSSPAVPLSPLIQESDLHHPRDLLFDDKELDRSSSSSSRRLPIPTPRVVGGNTVYSYTKHAYFAEWHNQFCGGALIHDDLVLTAAHCDNAGAIANNIYFKNIRRAESGSVIRSIAAHVTHPKFNAQISTRDYDYLLLKLDKSALVDDDGKPTGVEIIPINTDPGIPANNDELWGMGYGQVGETIAGMSPVLKDATIYAFANATCERQYRQYFEESYMFCSGVTGGGTDTCQGDSGGPIVHQASGTLVGVVSFGIGCARPNYAGVNARVSAVSDWLLRSMCEWSNFPKCNGSYAPTPAPTTETGGKDDDSENHDNSQNGGNNIPGSITISITYDDYPEEIAWGLMGPDSSRPLKFQPWKSVITPKSTQSETFDGLQQYITYSFKIADSEGDGICCSYGTGSVTVWDNVRDVELWKTRGNFGPYYEIEFYVLPNGHTRLTYRGEHYKPATWKDYETMMAPVNEPFWPGNLPIKNISTIMVNVETDDYPEEISWTLHHQSLSPSNLGQWDQVGTWSGVGATFRSLNSVEIPDLKRGWYRFIVRDSEGDGNCCEYGPGYISLTGPLAVTKGEKGLVWGNDGKFWGLDTIYFLVNEFGYISHTSKTEATITTGRSGSSMIQSPKPPPPSEP